jgi:hypothetical protein
MKDVRVWKTRLAVADRLRATTVVKAFGDSAERFDRALRDRALDVEMITEQRAE